MLVGIYIDLSTSMNVFSWGMDVSEKLEYQHWLSRSSANFSLTVLTPYYPCSVVEAVAFVYDYLCW